MSTEWTHGAHAAGPTQTHQWATLDRPPGRVLAYYHPGRRTHIRGQRRSYLGWAKTPIGELLSGLGSYLPASELRLDLTLRFDIAVDLRAHLVRFRDV